MRITQNYNGSTSHYAHSHGSPLDYPIDEGGSDQGRDPIYAPCDLIITRIWGVGTAGVNTIFAESTAQVKLANGKVGYVSFQITHPNDSDLRRLKVGQTIKKGSLICYEGTDGASANHIHLSVGLGKFMDKTRGWTLNSKNKYVIYTTGCALRPEDAFFVDPKFTVVKNSGGINFKRLPIGGKETAAVTYQTTDNLNIRSGAGTKYGIVGSLKKGEKVSVSETKTVSGAKWGKIAQGWICLKYAKKVTTK